MHQEKKKINAAGFDLITVQLTNIAQRMAFIETLYFEFGDDPYGTAIQESVRAAARNSIEDVRQIFKDLDEHTNIRSGMDAEELEWLCPQEVNDGSQNQREETR